MGKVFIKQKLLFLAIGLLGLGGCQYSAQDLNELFKTTPIKETVPTGSTGYLGQTSYPLEDMNAKKHNSCHIPGVGLDVHTSITQVRVEVIPFVSIAIFTKECDPEYFELFDVIYNEEVFFWAAYHQVDILKAIYHKAGSNILNDVTKTKDVVFIKCFEKVNDRYYSIFARGKKYFLQEIIINGNFEAPEVIESELSLVGGNEKLYKFVFELPSGEMVKYGHNETLEFNDLVAFECQRSANFVIGTKSAFDGIPPIKAI